MLDGLTEALRAPAAESLTPSRDAATGRLHEHESIRS
jgi:hypothetical protein